jgi:hypothetical protein
MKRVRFKLALAVVAAGALAVGIVAVAVAGGGHTIRAKLTGYQEVPALSTTGFGKFRASIDRGANEIHYRLTYGGLESAATQSHIHFENRTNAGPIVVSCARTLATDQRERRRAQRTAGRSAGRSGQPTSATERPRRALPPANSTSWFERSGQVRRT